MALVCFDYIEAGCFYMLGGMDKATTSWSSNVPFAR